MFKDHLEAVTFAQVLGEVYFKAENIGQIQGQLVRKTSVFGGSQQGRLYGTGNHNLFSCGLLGMFVKRKAGRVFDSFQVNAVKLI